MRNHTTCILLPAAIAAAAALPVLAAAPAGATAFKAPAVSVGLPAVKVREPGRLTVTLHASGCVSDVQAAAYNYGHGNVTRSTVARPGGRTFKVTITFPAGAPAGREVISDVFARPCGASRGQLPLIPSKGYFPQFQVTR